jgi:hypothetical protein
MKRKYLLTAMGGLLALAFVMGSAQTSFAANLPDTFDLVYDTYCDGLDIDKTTLLADKKTFAVQGHQTGCVSGDILGTNIKKKTVNVGYADDAYFDGLFTVIRKDGTWTHYRTCGTDCVEVDNEGTWSFGVPALTAGGLPSSTN